MTGLLIGRDVERARLRGLLEDVDVRIVFLRGPAGSGKTALATSILTDARLTGSLVGAGKYAEGGGDAAFGPIMSALTEAVEAALDQLYDPEAGLQSLNVQTRGALPVLAAAGFRAGAGGKTGQATGLSSQEHAVARVTVAAVEVLRWLRGFDLPVVLFIDDWRRASEAARLALATMISGSADLNLTVVLAERDDRAPDALARREGSHMLEVAGLSNRDRARLLGRSLGGDEAGEAVLSWLDGGGPVLPFDLLETARALAESGAVAEAVDGWRIDPERAGALDRPEVSRSVERRLAALPAEARRLAVGAALWGDAAPVDSLLDASGLDPADFERATDALIAAGLVCRRERTLRFNHDRLRASVLAALADEPVATIAGQMADRLARRSELAGDPVHTASLHLRAAGNVASADPTLWRDRFAEGARAARERADPAAAATFAGAALELHARAPSTAPGGLRLILGEGMLAAADAKDVAAVTARSRELLAGCATPVELGDAFALSIVALRLAGDVDAAWALALDAMARFGVRRLGPPTPVGVTAAAARWRLGRALPHAGGAGLRPELAEPLAKVADAAAVMAYERSPATAALVALRVSAAVGPAADGTPFWSATNAFIYAMLGDRQEAARVGRLAVAQMESGVPYRAAWLYRALYFGVVWSRPQGSLRARCAEIRNKALAEGDVVAAAVAVRNWAMLGWRSASSLDQLADEVDEAWREANLLGDPECILGLAHLRDAIALVRSPNGRNRVTERLDRLDPAHRVHWLLEMELASLWGDWNAAVLTGEMVRPYLKGFDNHPGGVNWRFHQALARLKIDRAPFRGDVAFVEMAARLNPDDHAHKVHLLRAEKLRRRRDKVAALAAYATAVNAANDADNRLEAGIAAECAADAARAFNEPDLADRYARRAAAIWAAWGARAKLRPAEVAETPSASTAEVDEARALAASADRSNRAKSRLLADVAHELRSPLQGMQGLLDLAAEDGRELDLKALSGVLASLKTVVDDLSEYGALTSGGAPLSRRAVDVAELVRSETALAASLPNRRVTGFNVSIDPDAPSRIESDEARLRQVVRNLLSNAVKYGGGSIQVHVSVADGDRYAITVEDEGDGIPEPDLLRLFEPFERGDLSRQDGDPGGLGLGLAVSRQVAQKLGGDLTAHNRPDGGACFRFTFRAQPASVTVADVASVRPLRVLVCDDVPLIRQVLAGLLRADGHHVSEAGDGLEAVAALDADTFDLAIVDLTMPRLNGLGVLRSVRDRAVKEARPRCVLLTASVREDLQSDAVEAGAAAVLRKPVSATDLRRVIARLFDDGVSPPWGPDLPPPATFRAEAEAELRAQITALLSDTETGPTAEAAHRAAGLAAQFGWPGLAAACERLEAALEAGRPAHEERADLAAACRDAFPGPTPTRSLTPVE